MRKLTKKSIGIMIIAAVSVSTLALACACGETELPEAELTFAGLEAVYDGTNKEVSVSVAPADAGEVSVTYWVDGQEVYQCVNAGTYTVKAEFTSETHKTETVEKTLTIAQKTLTLSGVTALDVFYDGTTVYDAGIHSPSFADAGHYHGTPELTGIVEGDTVELDTLKLVADTSAYGFEQEVFVEATLTGASAANYKVALSEPLTAGVYPVKDGFGLIPVEEEGSIVSYTVGRYMGSAKEITIPSEYNGIPVTATRAYLFVDNWLKVGGEPLGVTKITVPASIVNIGHAFAQNNTTLKTLVFENRTTPINWGLIDGGAWTVAGCTAIESVSFGTGFGTIPRAFAQSSGIASVDLTNVTAIGDFAFAWTKLASVTIPANVTSMGTAVFQDCSALKVAVFEDREEQITFALGDMEGSWMFFLDHLDELVIGEGIASLPKIFVPTSVETVTLGKDVATLGAEALPNAKTVTTLYLDSQTICDSLNADGFFANVVYLYLNNDVTVSAYITENYTVDETDTTAGYTKYVKN